MANKCCEEGGPFLAANVALFETANDTPRMVKLDLCLDAKPMPCEERGTSCSRSALAPESALGSVCTVALSSVQVEVVVGSVESRTSSSPPSGSKGGRKCAHRSVTFSDEATRMFAVALIILALIIGCIVTYFLMDAPRRRAEEFRATLERDQSDLATQRERFHEEDRQLQAVARAIELVGRGI